MHDPTLTTEPEAQAQAIYQRLKDTFEAEALRRARLLASQDDAHLRGATEFRVRDRVHALGAQVLQTARDERKKGGTQVPVRPAPPAARTPAAWAGGKKPS